MGVLLLEARRASVVEVARRLAVVSCAPDPDLVTLAADDQWRHAVDRNLLGPGSKMRLRVLLDLGSTARLRQLRLRLQVGGRWRDPGSPGSALPRTYQEFDWGAFEAAVRRLAQAAGDGRVAHLDRHRPPTSVTCQQHYAAIALRLRGLERDAWRRRAANIVARRGLGKSELTWVIKPVVVDLRPLRRLRRPLLGEHVAGLAGALWRRLKRHHWPVAGVLRVGLLAAAPMVVSDARQHVLWTGLDAALGSRLGMFAQSVAGLGGIGAVLTALGPTRWLGSRRRSLAVTILSATLLVGGGLLMLAPVGVLPASVLALPVSEVAPAGSLNPAAVVAVGGLVAEVGTAGLWIGDTDTVDALRGELLPWTRLWPDRRTITAMMSPATPWQALFAPLRHRRNPGVMVEIEAARTALAVRSVQAGPACDAARAGVGATDAVVDQINIKVRLLDAAPGRAAQSYPEDSGAGPGEVWERLASAARRHAKAVKAAGARACQRAGLGDVDGANLHAAAAAAAAAQFSEASQRMLARLNRALDIDPDAAGPPVVARSNASPTTANTGMHPTVPRPGVIGRAHSKRGPLLRHD